MRRLFPTRPANETRLLHDVRHAEPELAYDSLTGAALARLTASRGVDFATALLYDRLRRSAEHGPFIAALESIQPDLDSLPRLPWKMVVAPGAFYREHPETGADGWLMRQVAAEFGMETAVAPCASGGSVTANAAILQRELAAESPGSVVLVSLSKGSADARLALEGANEPASRAVHAWVQVCGLVRGTPVADAALACWWKRALLHAHFAYRGWDLDLLRELQHGPGSLLAPPVAMPGGLRSISVVGFPLVPHLTRDARRRHRFLAAFGPNDGSGLLLDQFLEPGLVYPVWGADHYFRVPALSPLLYRLFLYLHQAGSADPVPAGGRPAHRVPDDGLDGAGSS
jgi:hypothetical protein